MSFLDAAAKRLETEQRARIHRLQAEKQKQERLQRQLAENEHKLALHALERQRQQEEAAAAQAVVEEQKRLEREKRLEKTHGIDLDVTLQWFASDRQGDRMELGPSILHALTEQDAPFPWFFAVSRVGDDDNEKMQDVDVAAAEVSSSSAMTTKGPALVTHAGALEFSAADGTVVLPRKILHTLGLIGGESEEDGEETTKTTRVRVQYVRLPKGTRAVLQPMDGGFYRIHESRAVLEASLRAHCSTISTGDIVSIEHAGRLHKLRVRETTPPNHVSLIDTDVEVHIVDPEPSDLTRNDSGVNHYHQHHQSSLEVGGAAVQVGIPVGEMRYFRFVVSDALAHVIASGQQQLCVRVNTESGGDADVWVDTGFVERPSRLHHRWGMWTLGSKTVQIGKTQRSRGGGDGDEFAGAGVYFVGVEGVQAPPSPPESASTHTDKNNTNNKVVDVHVQVVVGDAATSEMTDVDENEEDGVEEGMVKCSFCKQAMPQQNIMMHETFCQRFLEACDFPGCAGVRRKGGDGEDHWHCPECAPPHNLHHMTRAQGQKHVDSEHTVLVCGCGERGVLSNMLWHVRVECPQRMILCTFCGQRVMAGEWAVDAADRMRGLSAHEASCGARTGACEYCNMPVRLKDMTMHIKAFHDPTVHVAQPAYVPPPLPTPPHSNRTSPVPPPQAQPSATVTCPLCGVSVGGASERAMSDHFNAVHNSDDSSQEQQRQEPQPQQEDRMQDEEMHHYSDGEILPVFGAGNSSSALPPPTTAITQSAAPQLQCPICEVMLATERQMSQHMDKDHP